MIATALASVPCQKEACRSILVAWLPAALSAAQLYLAIYSVSDQGDISGTMGPNGVEHNSGVLRFPLK